MPSVASPDDIDAVRRFNRAVTEHVGALNDRYLGRERALGEARLLWEIAAEGCEVRLLRSRLHQLRPPAGHFFVAYLHGEPIGCGAVKHHDDAPHEIKRMWIAPAARGLGLGRRLLETLEGCAAATGARVARIETNEDLSEAL